MRKGSEHAKIAGAGADPIAGWTWWIPDLGWLLFCVSSGFIGFFVTFAALPLWATDQGISLRGAGMVTTVMLAATVASQLAVPAVIRAIGPVPSLMLGLLVLGAAGPCYLVDSGYGWLLALSALRGMGFAFVTVVSIALLARFTHGERRTRAIGIHGLAVNIPNLFAVPLGVYLVSANQFTLLAWISAVPVLAVLTVGPLTRQARETASAAVGRRAGRALGAPARGAYAPACVLLATCVCAVAVMTFLPIEGPSSNWAAVALLAFGVTATFARWRLGPLAHRWGISIVLPIVVLFMVAGMGVLAVSLVLDVQGFALLGIIGGALCGVGYGGVQSLTLMSALSRVPREGVAGASAIWNIAFDTGLGGGAFLVGFLSDAGLGMALTFGLAAAAASATLWLARRHAGPLPPEA